MTKTTVHFQEPRENNAPVPMPDSLHKLAREFGGTEGSLDYALEIFTAEATKQGGRISLIEDRRCIAYTSEHESGYLLIKYEP